MSKELNNFGKIFINEVRDSTIEVADKMVEGTMKGLTAQSVQEKFRGFTDEQIEAVKFLIPKIVDLSLHNMLCMIEEYEEINLLYDNKNIKEESDGLSGELYTEDGWIEQFSTRRYNEM